MAGAQEEGTTYAVAPRMMVGRLSLHCYQSFTAPLRGQRRSWVTGAKHAIYQTLLGIGVVELADWLFGAAFVKTFNI